MAFKNIAIAVAVFVLFVGGAFTVYQVADQGQNAAADESKNVTNESLAQEYDAWQYVGTALDEYTTGFNDSVTVYNETDIELEQGTDYQWNGSDGTITFEDTMSTNESNTSTISYQYYENTQAVQEVSGPIDTTVEAIGRTGFMAAGLGLVVILLAIAGFVGRKFTNSMPESNR